VTLYFCTFGNKIIMANYLVTGAAGFIGAALAQRLINENHVVVTIDNLSTGFESNIPKQAEFIKGDCGDPAIYNQLPGYSYDAIIHIAGQSSGEISFDDPIYDIRTNAESTVLLLQFALKNQCKRFIYASTMSVYGVHPEVPIGESAHCNPESFYGVAKLASEQYLRIYQQYGIDSTSLRLFNVYGPGQNLENLRQGMVSIFLAQLMNNNHIHVKGSRERFRDFIYIDDVVEGFISCLGNEKTYGKNINIATGIKTTVEELIGLLIKVSGSNVTVQYEGSTPGDIHGIYGDTHNMHTLLGLKNCMVLEDGLARMWNSHRGKVKG